MLNLYLTIAWSWWQWSLVSAGALLCVCLLLLAVRGRRPKRHPRKDWKRYNRDSRYL